MKIALLQPRYGDNRNPSLPVGLAYIATPLIEAGHEVIPILLDLNTDLSFEDVAYKIKEENFEVLGISALVTRYKLIKQLTRTVKKTNPDVPIIIGGKIADSIPEKLAVNTPADVICFGEGEHLVVELMDAFKGKRSFDSVDGIFYLKNGSFHRTKTRAPIKDLDSIAFPSYDIFPIERYKKIPLPDFVPRLIAGARQPVAIKSSRGCPFVCTFCRRSFEPKNVRLRSIPNIVDELQLLKSKYGYDSAIFNDELTLTSKTRAFELAEGMRNSKLNMNWHCLSRVDFIDRDIIRELKSAGCTSLGFGIESGSQIILNEINKKVTVENAKRVLRLCDEEDMIVNCTFIFGMPSETHYTIKETINFMKETGVRGPLFYATAYPGTALWDHAIKTGKIKDEEAYLDKLNDATDFVANFTNLNDAEFKKLYAEATAEKNSYFFLQDLKANPIGTLKKELLNSFNQRGFLKTIYLSVKYLYRILYKAILKP